MKSIGSIAALASFLVSLPACTSNPKHDGSQSSGAKGGDATRYSRFDETGRVLRIGPERITVDEITDPLRALNSRNDSDFSTSDHQKAAELIRIKLDETLLFAEASKEITEQEDEYIRKFVDQLIRHEIQSNHGGRQATYERELEQQGLTFKQAWDRKRREILIQRYLSQRVFPMIADPTRAELWSYFEQAKDDLSQPERREMFLIDVPLEAESTRANSNEPRTSVRAEASEPRTSVRAEASEPRTSVRADSITRETPPLPNPGEPQSSDPSAPAPPGANPWTEQDALADGRSRIENAYRELQKGVPFETVARTYSKGIHAEDGGAWGLITEGSLKSRWKSAADVLFSLKEGAFSEVLSTDDGFMIVKCGRIEPAVDPDFQEVQPELQKRYRRAQEAVAYQNLLRDLRQKYQLDLDQVTRFLDAVMKELAKPD